uniref:Elongator acetyltransferase complex subunit 4 n=1 Tax=Ailuropoda melanoleuca TaxID=9646 RepID=A0A7N5KHF2_AILME
MAAVATCGTGAGSTGSIAAAASKNNVTSFQRKGPRASGTDSGCSRLVSIAGTRPSVRNGQLLVSTGLPALDQLLGSSWFPTYKSLYRCERWASLENAKKV